MKGSGVRLLLQFFRAEETQQKGHGFTVLSPAGGDQLSAGGPGVAKALVSEHSVWPPGIETLSGWQW